MRQRDSRQFCFADYLVFNTGESGNICEGGWAVAAFVTFNLLELQVVEISHLASFREISVSLIQPAWIDIYHRCRKRTSRMGDAKSTIIAAWPGENSHLPPSPAH